MKRRADRASLRGGVMFDIDGVLVDVRSSYIDCIRKTVNLYLQKIMLVPAYAGALLSRDDVNAFKLLGGLNNDWDTVYAILLYLQAQVEKGPRKWEILSLKKLRGLLHLKKLANSVPKPCGLAPFKKLIKDQGLISYALAKDMFQENYLGEKLFAKDEKRPPLFSRAKGLIHLEKLFFKKPLLRKLRAMHFDLGIVTGRTRFEAEYVLKRFGIRKFFKALITHDDVAAAEKKSGRILRKPHPFPVLACARKIGPGGRPGPIRPGQLGQAAIRGLVRQARTDGSGRHPRRDHIGQRSFVYVGDLPDDIRAANGSKAKIKIVSCGVLYGQDNAREAEREFKKAHADLMIKRPTDLLSAVRSER